MRRLSMSFLRPFRSPLRPLDWTTTTAATSSARQRVRISYLALYSIHRHFSTSSSCPSPSQFHRSDFTNQPYTGSYEPGLPTSGPLGSAPSFGTPRLTPKMLKQHLDQFVVGQDRAKKVLSVAVYNHYQRVQELQRREEEEEELMAQQARRESVESHPVETEFPGQQRTIHTHAANDDISRPEPLPVDTSPLTLEKSNILLLGPSGVGKTLMAKTLARVLSVPFSMSDCTPLTQAGYIGEDADVCVHRLLAAANYDVAQAERGIICLDEVDKIATAKVSHGKDVSGEGVQQALLKIIEGTTVQIQAKPERNAPRSGGSLNSNPGGSGSFGGSSFSSPAPPGSSGKAEVYNVRTDNILFIFSGAFVGLNKVIMDRISRGSIGFGQPVRALTSSFSSQNPSQGASSPPIPILPGSAEEALYKKHLPFFTPAPMPSTSGSADEEPTYFNPLDLLTPPDLQTYGFIPELVGRIPITTALSQLTHRLLLRILTEPRNSLLAQYTTLFALSGIELRFTTPALHKIASNAMSMATGARGLRTEMEMILGDAMFEAPGSSVKFVLVTEDVASRKAKAAYLARGQGGKFHAMIAAEESEWEDKMRKQKEGQEGNDRDISFEQWRSRSRTDAAVGGVS
ncbi:ATP-dependent Clp protease ATP-binding subunit clpX [Paracoccidioides lutzii Pb01]|uniref:ATP-dependent Clp protease ATP-binding subunit clpX n=1 Tax=Paracoccidioides lutzii (strain ATCC MYA-826 / Pb01) TaxID=502779 RepID=C1HBF4_PARBA|nr:ATP-dependent Clp protease ATP-binding subunit clpX [Paracoccidioides lutzii Pb01]EEH37677.2 ATP-dependent Clp protease ATP-binding subunit clpX [Paracoccidioides lutzii Pb01]